MSQFSALASLINARNLSGVDLINHFADAFSQDAMHYVNANNSQPLDMAIACLPMGKAQIKGKQNQALGEAIAQGVKATREALPNSQGWIGAVHGAFSKASKETRTPYLMAHAQGIEAFKASLITSGAFPDKVSRTDEEKAAIKAEKADKAAQAQAETMKAARDALIASGEFIAKSDVITIDKMSTSLLVDALISRDADTFSPETLGMLAALVQRMTVPA